MVKHVTMTEAEAECAISGLADAQAYREQQAGAWPLDHPGGICPEPCPAQLADLDRAADYAQLSARLATRLGTAPESAGTTTIAQPGSQEAADAYRANRERRRS